MGDLPTDNDGILDVLANLVGVLTLVGALSAILAANSAVKIKTPLAQSTDKSFIILQAGGEGVWDLQPGRERLDALMRQRAEGWRRCLDGGLTEMLLCGARMKAWSARETVGGTEVSIDAEEASLQRIGPPSESVARLRQEKGWLQQKLAQARQENKAVFVILEKEGFESYRIIRSAAAREGLQLGWEPWSTGAAVSFGSEGRSLNVQ